MSSLCTKLTERAKPGFWVEFQNCVWESVYRGRDADLTRRLDKTSLHLPYLAHPAQEEMIEECLRHCVQALLYTTWLERSQQVEVILADNLKIAVRESSHVLYWAVRHRGREFMPGFCMPELVISAKHTGIVRHILDILIQAPTFHPVLRDGVCLLHLAVLVGHKFEKSDQSVDLVSNFLIRSAGHVAYTCPWSGKTSLDFTLEHDLVFQSKQLYILGCRAHNMKEEESQLSRDIVKVRIPSGDSGDASEGILKFKRS
jgi:hypothetical protein